MDSIVSKTGKKIVSVATHISPTFGCKVLYFLKTGKKLNLKSPQSFNEKLMYLKLSNYNHNKDVWECSDKYTMREWVKQRGVSDENLPVIIDTYNNANEIDFSQLPDKFVLKCTHGMGFNIICEDKTNINIKKTKKQLNKWLNKRFGYETAELHYNHIKPRIICEEFIENPDGGFPNDYKIYCFHGQPQLILVCTDRKNGYKTSFYDMNWDYVKVGKNEINAHIKKPESFDKMIEIAKLVSKDFPFVRVDFYESDKKPILGEMTFTPAACVGSYTQEANEKLGKLIVEYSK